MNFIMTEVITAGYMCLIYLAIQRKHITKMKSKEVTKLFYYITKLFYFTTIQNKEGRKWGLAIQHPYNSFLKLSLL